MLRDCHGGEQFRKNTSQIQVFFLLPAPETTSIPSLLDNRRYEERRKWSKINLPKSLGTTALIWIGGRWEFWELREGLELLGWAYEGCFKAEFWGGFWKGRGLSPHPDIILSDQYPDVFGLRDRIVVFYALGCGRKVLLMDQKSKAWWSAVASSDTKY